MPHNKRQLIFDEQKMPTEGKTTPSTDCDGQTEWPHVEDQKLVDIYHLCAKQFQTDLYKA